MLWFRLGMLEVGRGLPTPQAQPSRFPAAKVEQVKFDATSLHAKPQMAAQQKMVDDGSGEVEVRLWEGRGTPPGDAVGRRGGGAEGAPP